MPESDQSGQESLYHITADEQMRMIRERRDIVVRLRGELSRDFEARKAKRDLLKKAEGDLEMAIGGEMQTSMDATSLVLPDSREPVTNATIKEKRRELIWEQVVKALKACGGRADNMKLASLTGASPHGLAGILTGCPFVRKVHDGRAGNEVTSWEIVE